MPREYRFASPDDVAERLRAVGYLAGETAATVVFLADRLGKPVLVEGPAGTGKTELAKALADVTGTRLLRLQCYEGVDEAKALYEWNYKKQLLRIQAERDRELPWEDLEAGIFTEEFLLERPVLAAIRSPEPVTLLVDEVDRADLEFEALLLEVLADLQVTVPEMGTITARSRPLVVLTSNNTRDLSEALRRRCLFLFLDYPDPEREKAIVLARVPEIPETLADQVVRLVRAIRRMDLAKPPSVAETLDWARTLLHLGVDVIDESVVGRTLTALLKSRGDMEKAAGSLEIPPRTPGA